MKQNAKILAQGSFIRICSFFITAIVAFVMIPFVIRSLGDKSYGLWIFIASFFDISGLFDLGFSSSVQRYLSRALGTQDYKEANIIVNTSLFLLSVIGAIALVFVIGATFLVPLFVKNITEVALFKQIIVILGLSFALSFPMKVFSGVLTSNLRYDLLTGISIARLLLKTALIVVFLKLGYGIVALAFITLFADLLSYLAGFIVAQKVAGYLTLSGSFIVPSRIKALFQYGAHTFINKIADNLRFGIDNLVITIFLGLSFVTLFSIASRLITCFIDFISNGINVLMPVFSRYESKGDYQSIREKFILTSKISGYASILVAGILLIFGKMFIIRWMGNEYSGAYALLAIMVIPVGISLMQCPSVEALYGVSKQKYYTISNIFEGVANLILSVILVKKYGLLGVALGTAIPMLVIKLFVQPVYTCRVIGLSLRYYYIELIGMTLLKSCLILGILWLLIKSFIVPNYFVLFYQILVSLALVAVVSFFIGFKRREQDYLKRICA